jgi:hypothetical protein
MTNHIYEMKCGFFACLSTLNKRLGEMSHGAYQWMSVIVPEVFLSSEGEPLSYVIIGYSNPDTTKLQNHLCFLLPLAAPAGSREPNPYWLVRFSPWSTFPLSSGLYWEKDRNLKYDPIEDFDRFWTPLKQRLCPQTMEGHIGRHEREPEWVGQTIDAAPFREALGAHMIWLSQSRETIQNALDD